MQLKKSTNILILSSLANSLVGFRIDLINMLLSKGYNVFAAAPNFDPQIASDLNKMGVITVEYKLQRTGLNPWKDVKSMFAIRKIILDNQINLLFPYTIKPVIYGSIAGQLTGTTVVSLITGLGLTFSRSSRKAQILQKITQILYKIALSKNKSIIFQNNDDLLLFREKKIISKHKKVFVVDGSGIHLDRYAHRKNTNTSKKIIFVLVARLIKEKGVELYLSAAEILKHEFSSAEFHIIGKPDHSPSAISIDTLEEHNANGIIVYHGFQKNVMKFLDNSDVFVLPTYYREGIPRSILEALSIGMPIITTDTPGCKETVLNGQNGILIEPQHLDDLIRAMRYYLENPNTIYPQGIESRKIAVERFDVEIINSQILKILEDNG
jgi:glycosyltransferase involved in cell wall biosynthesis